MPIKPLYLALLLSFYVSHGFCHTSNGDDEAQRNRPVIDGNGEEILPGDSDQERAERLNSLVQSIDRHRAQLKEMSARLSEPLEEADAEALGQEKQVIQERHSRLRKSLDQIAIGGMDISVMSEVPENDVSWQDEVQQILLPVLASMRELTARPRRIEALRTEIALGEERLKVVRKALGTALATAELGLSSEAREQLDQIISGWSARETELVQSLEYSRVQLTSMTEEKTRWRESLSSVFEGFIRNRGITLLLAMGAGLLVWLFIRSLLFLYERIQSRRRGPRSRTRVRLAQFAVTSVTMVTATTAIIGVFYLRSDVLLFTLSIIFLVFLLLSARQVLPRFVKEARLLLNIGAVREGERVLIDGVPFEVKSINVFCLFANPHLRGLRRLPISALDSMTSRPSIGDEEPWFPTRADDVVLFPDATIGQVVSQTIDFVRLRVLNSPVTIPVAEFINERFRNLSQEGFSLAVVFGIDYQHQALILGEAPTAFEQGVRRRLEQRGLSQQLRELDVDFGDAGASSLDLRILVDFDGTVASQYFGIQRLVKRACVEVCNQRGWVIPFAQVTVHQGEGFGRLSAHRVPNPDLKINGSTMLVGLP